MFKLSKVGVKRTIVDCYSLPCFVLHLALRILPTPFYNTVKTLKNEMKLVLILQFYEA